jgi:hypothetical protein
MHLGKTREKIWRVQDRIFESLKGSTDDDIDETKMKNAESGLTT